MFRKFSPPVHGKTALSVLPWTLGLLMLISILSLRSIGFWPGEERFLVGTFYSLYGSFSWGILRFSVEDFQKGLVLGSEDLKQYRFSEISEDFFAQNTAAWNGGFLVTGGKPGKNPGSGKVFFVAKNGRTETYMSTPDYRIRNFTTAKINSERYFVAVSHGEWYVHLRSLDSWKERILHVPYRPRIDVWGDSYATLLHFVDATDLDDDGNDEIYLTRTTPYMGVSWAREWYSEWTVTSISFNPGNDKPVIKDLEDELPAFPRRLMALDSPFQKSVLVLYDGMIDGSGRPIRPVRIYRYFHWPEGDIEKAQVAELEGHVECKTISAVNFYKDPTIQIGCDNSTLYFFREKPNSLEIEKIDEMRFSEDLITEEYLKKRSYLTAFKLYSVRAVFGKDLDGDGLEEMVVWISNDGFYLLDAKTPEDRSKRIRFQFKGWDRIIDRDESFVINDGAFEKQ